MSDIVIRELTITDLELLKLSDAFDHTVDSEQADEFLREERNLIVAAIHESGIVGFVSGTILLHPDKQPILFINEVGMNDEFQRRGLATRMIDTILTLARSKGCQGVWLATEEDNDAARALYRKAGARETREIVIYDWDGAMDD